MAIQTDGVVQPPLTGGGGRDWWPVERHGSPWLHGRPAITVTRTWVVEQGPQLLRVADAERKDATSRSPTPRAG
jgi:hypothetical protein